jgi:hypothetical protein
MSKPFKSQFDLMAEAYGNVNYSKQRIINEDTAGKTVIGYPPSKLNEVHSFHSEGDDDYYYDESDYNRVLDLVDKKGRGWKESSVTSGVEEDHVDQFLKDMQKWMDDNNIDGGPGVGDHKEGLFAASLRKAEEAGENEEGKEKAYKYTVIENDKEASIQPMEYRQPEGDLIKIVKSDGIVKKCYQHPEGREWTVESDRPIDFNQAGSWTWDEDSEEDYEEPGPQLGGDLDPGEVNYDVTEVEDAEEAGFNRKQLDELEDIVHAILDKRDHEERAAKHEDGEH